MLLPHHWSCIPTKRPEGGSNAEHSVVGGEGNMDLGGSTGTNGVAMPIASAFWLHPNSIGSFEMKGSGTSGGGKVEGVLQSLQ